MLEDAFEGVVDDAHHEAVEQRHLPSSAGARENAPARQELEALENVVEAVGPELPIVRLDRGQGTCHTAPGILDAPIIGDGTIVEAVFRPPNLLGDRDEVFRHSDGQAPPASEGPVAAIDPERFGRR